MLFTGLMWGAKIRRTGLLQAIWPLKTALFQLGDDLIEKVALAVGMERVKDHFNNVQSDKEFYLFLDKHVELAQATQIWTEMKEGYNEALNRISFLFPQTVVEEIVSRWVQVTNVAIESAFFCLEWEQALEKSDYKLLDEIRRREMEAKNVKVVTKWVSCAEPLGFKRPYQSREEEIIRACSCFFTALDDFIDVQQDLKGKQPNQCVSDLIRNDEIDSTEETKDREAWAMHLHAPKSYADFLRRYEKAKDSFMKTFPVFPSYFCKKIEKQAFDSKKSPF